jgi:hypothetical protein
MGVLTVLLAAQVIGAGSAFAGPLNAASGVGALVGALAAARCTGRRARAGAVGAVGLLVSTLACLTVPDAPAVALMAMAGTTAALVLLDTLNVTAVQVAAGEAATGRAVGLLHTLAAAWMLVGTGLATVVAATAGPAIAVLAVAAAAGAIGVAGLLLAQMNATRPVARLGGLTASMEGSS